MVGTWLWLSRAGWQVTCGVSPPSSQQRQGQAIRSPRQSHRDPLCPGYLKRLHLIGEDVDQAGGIAGHPC